MIVLNLKKESYDSALRLRRYMFAYLFLKDLDEATIKSIAVKFDKEAEIKLVKDQVDSSLLRGGTINAKLFLADGTSISQEQVIKEVEAKLTPFYTLAKKRAETPAILLSWFNNVMHRDAIFEILFPKTGKPEDAFVTMTGLR